MQSLLGKVIVTVGVLAAVGVGVWNALELRHLRKQLVAMADAPAVEVTTPKDTPDMGVAKELMVNTHTPYTVAAQDILRIDLNTDQQVVRQIQGEHLIRPDGTIGLGEFGSLSVAGMTLPQVKAALVQHLSKWIPEAEVKVDVAAFNSQCFYVITDVAGSVENVVRLPVTGNETVLDAIAKIGGLAEEDARKIWIARRSPNEVDQILPVDWKGITQHGHTRTNYQLLPGDRVYLKKAG